jgi:hypothetical protein
MSWCVSVGGRLMVGSGVGQVVLQNSTELLAIGAIGLLLGVGLIGLGGKRFQTGQLIKNTSPEKARSVAVGRTELRGKARDAGVVFDKPFTDGKCLFFSYEVEQYVRERTTDSDGNTQTEKKWETTSSQSLAAPFYLDDGTGQILVVANAGPDFEISDENKFTETFSGRTIPGEYQKQIDTSVDIADAITEDIEWEPYNLSTKIDSKVPFFSVPGTSNDVKPRNSGAPQQPDFSPHHTSGQILKRRISQTVLPVDADVYVFGAATQRKDPMGSNEQRLIIQGDEDTGRFIISDKGESDLSKTYTRWGIGYMAVGILLTALTVGFLANGGL